MLKEENWAISIEQAEGFFSSFPGVELDTNGFRFRSCRIHMETLPSLQMGSISFPRTRVRFQGEPEDVQKIYHHFFLQFLSAGG